MQKKTKNNIIFVLSVTFIAYLIFRHVFRSEYSSKELDSSKIELDYEAIYRQKNLENIHNIRHFSHLQSTHRCSNHSLDILILVTSHVNNFIRRERIRKSWGRLFVQSKRFKTFFVVGKCTDAEVMAKADIEEATYSNDLVRADVIEHFYNLSRKIQVAFEWSYKYCSYNYLLKFDDDVFPNLKLIYTTLANKYTFVASEVNLFIGHTMVNHFPQRSGKYKINYDVYRKSHYPTFCSGGGFILSRGAVKSIIPFMNVSTTFLLDDVYLAFLVFNANIEPIHDQMFDNFENSDPPKIDCRYNSSAGVFHPVKTNACFRQLHFGMLEDFKEHDEIVEFNANTWLRIVK